MRLGSSLRFPLLLAVAATCLLFAPRRLVPLATPPPPLRQEAYVWQRVQDAGVKNAVRVRGPTFYRLTYLAAEIAWTDASGGAPAEITRVDVDPPAITRDAQPLALGLALRVHAYRGSFAPDAPATRRLIALARECVSRAESRGHRVEELQIDFDAAESQLDAYRGWIEALRAAVAPVPVAFTALPSWLDHPRAFARLADAADGFVLQVHSLVLPRTVDSLPGLCDPAQADVSVRRAARAGVPFRVALPTYGYEVGFDAEGRFAGLSADGSARVFRVGETVREVRADPAGLARLVSKWQRRRPAALAGVVWYRLPVGEERLNWAWPTLAAVMEGRAPAPRLRIEADRSADPALVTVALANEGEGDACAPLRVELKWTGARRLAADALAGFAFEAETADGARLVAPARFRLPPGSGQPFAWLRFDRSPVSFHATPVP